MLSSSRVLPSTEWSALQASALTRRPPPASSSSDPIYAPPPLPPLFDSTYSTGYFYSPIPAALKFALAYATPIFRSSNSSAAQTPAPPLPRYASPLPSFSGVVPVPRHSGGDTPSSASGWARESAGTPAFLAASAAATAAGAGGGEVAGQKELRNEIASLQVFASWEPLHAFFSLTLLSPRYLPGCPITEWRLLSHCGFIMFKLVKKSFFASFCSF
jgi:hypothetical protein